MDSKKILISISISVCLCSCREETENPTDKLAPSLSGKIVGIEQFEEIRVLDINTKNSVLYGDGAYDSRPIWSYEGTQFATFKFRQNSLEEDTIKIVDIVNNSITNWRTGDGSYDLHNSDITWSPDGNTIAYLGKDINIFISEGINYLDVKNGSIINAQLALPDTLGISAIAWHPKLNKIAVCAVLTYPNLAFYMYDHYLFFLFMIDPYQTNLKNETRIINFETNDHYSAEHLDWSLDGKMLLISTHQDNIYVFNTEEEKIKKIPNILGHSACWSADGEYILYSRWRWLSINEAVNDLHVTDINGSFDYIFRKNYESNLVDWY